MSTAQNRQVYDAGLSLMYRGFMECISTGNSLEVCTSAAESYFTKSCTLTPLYDPRVGHTRAYTARGASIPGISTNVEKFYDCIAASKCDNRPRESYKFPSQCSPCMKHLFDGMMYKNLRDVRVYWE